jgi:hypothetical protein
MAASRWMLRLKVSCTLFGRASHVSHVALADLAWCWRTATSVMRVDIHFCRRLAASLKLHARYQHVLYLG